MVKYTARQSTIDQGPMKKGGMSVLWIPRAKVRLASRI